MDTPKETARMLLSIPKGFAVIRSGEIRPGDLLYVWPGGGWDRADSNDWLIPAPKDAEDATLCVRRAEHFHNAEGTPNADEFGGYRRYRISKEPPPKPIPAASPQRSLF